MNNPQDQEAKATQSPPQAAPQEPVTDMRQLRKQRARQIQADDEADAKPQPIRRPKVGGAGPQIGGGISMAMMAMIAVGVLNRQCNRPPQRGVAAAAVVQPVAQAHEAKAALPVPTAKRQALAS